MYDSWYTWITGGNPLAMSVANVVLDHLKKDFLEHVQKVGNYLKKIGRGDYKLFPV